ncbi:aldose 1-epimerase family protein [Flavobacterium sp. W1B]|uniref:aldose 1-epimerase family protein n=1 Tax=Flavobacterium sp. W1B TaxID=3394146 RepID=UPI0039BD01BA
MTTTITNSKLTAQINHAGAELFSLKDSSNKEYIWEGNPEFWGKHSPILFPIVGTLKNNSFQFNNKEYSLSRHGFARDMVFNLIDKKENSATFSIQSTADTLKIYPFDFELQINYTLYENSLEIQYTVVNKSKYQMPFSLGAHPAFYLSGNFEDYSLEFEKDEVLEYHLLENGLISDETKKCTLQNSRIPITYQLFENDALVFKKMESKTVTIIKNQSPILKVQYEDFPSLGIWTIENAPFLCIEPWFGYSDTTGSNGDLFTKEGIQILDPNQSFKPKFSIEIL